MSIQWLVQGTGSDAHLIEGMAPPGLLNPPELEVLAGFRVPKRRRDWLLGRWTAKHLVQKHLEDTSPSVAPLSSIHIGNDADGAPYAALLSAPQQPYSLNRLAISISISHSGHRSLCALWPALDAQVGADMELVEAREWSFVESFFTEHEIAAAGAAEQPDVVVTAFWSAKEAVLKTLRTGLRVDTRRISCAIPTIGLHSDQWTPISITLDPTLLPARIPESTFRVWQLLQSNFVLTLALLKPQA